MCSNKAGNTIVATIIIIMAKIPVFQFHTAFLLQDLLRKGIVPKTSFIIYWVLCLLDKSQQQDISIKN